MIRGNESNLKAVFDTEELRNDTILRKLNGQIKKKRIQIITLFTIFRKNHCKNIVNIHYIYLPALVAIRCQCKCVFFHSCDAGLWNMACRAQHRGSWRKKKHMRSRRWALESHKTILPCEWHHSTSCLNEKILYNTFCKGTFENTPGLCFALK